MATGTTCMDFYDNSFIEGNQCYLLSSLLKPTTDICRFQHSSVTVQDLMQMSEFISKGPPAQYRLLTSRSNFDENGSVGKRTFGQQKVTMENKILLMVGETGTGKTTLVNAMVNYILGVKFTDEKWFEITEEKKEDKRSDQTKSQTTKITVYEVFSQNNPMSLTIIDTPGYGDTRGTDYDKQIAENLYKLFHSDSGVKEIDAVCLVMKATENRLSDRQQYVFDAVLSLFGKDIENNIVILITHSDGMPPDNALNAIKKAGIPYRKDEDNEPEHFLFNNRQKNKRSERYNPQLQTAWNETEESLKDLFFSLTEQNRKSLKQTESVLKESKRLEACISNIQERIKYVESKSTELTQIQKALQENRGKIQKNENFIFTVTKYYKEKVFIENAHWWNRKATSCDVKTSIEKRLKEDLDKKEKEKCDLVDEAYTSIMKLLEIALKPDSAFIVQALGFLIPRAEETGKSNYAHNLRKLRKIQPESEERVSAAMGYARAGFDLVKNTFTSKKKNSGD